MADRRQIERWRQLLGAERPASAGPPPQRPLRNVLLYCVAATRNGSGADLTTDLPPLPVRRPAEEGEAVVGAVWAAYFLFALGVEDAARWLSGMAATLDPTALVFTIDDNPEPWWQAEMVILHALHSYALLSGDAGALDKTLECAAFHLAEIQPDHATNEPWAVHAYASHPDGNVTAETLWHAAHIQHGGRVGPVAALLAADAAFALSAWLDRAAAA